MTHSQHSAPNALLYQARQEARRTAQAWQFGFITGIFFGVLGSVILCVPLVVWMVRP